MTTLEPHENRARTLLLREWDTGDVARRDRVVFATAVCRAAFLAPHAPVLRRFGADVPPVHGGGEEGAAATFEATMAASAALEPPVQLQASIKYEQDELSACKSLLDGCLPDDPDTVINFAAIAYKEGEYDDARTKYLEAREHERERERARSDGIAKTRARGARVSVARCRASVGRARASRSRVRVRVRALSRAGDDDARLPGRPRVQRRAHGLWGEAPRVERLRHGF